MDFLQNILAQGAQQWRRSSVGGRVSLIAATAAVILVVAGVGYWSSRPDFVPVISGISPTETAEIIGVLDAKGIPTSMNSVGTSVLVPSSRLNEARVAAGDLLNPISGSTGEIPGLSIIDDPRTREVRLRHAEQTALERSILRMKAVAAADVHIAKPEPDMFSRHREPSTASVMVTLRPGVPFTKQQAGAIVALVSSSIDGLAPENVTVTDSYGRILWNGGAAGDSAGSDLNELRRRIEDELVSKVDTILRRMLGADRFSAQVTAEIDFTELVREKLTYDEEGKSKTRENIETSKTTGPSGPSGATGTASNQALAGAGRGGAQEIGNTESLQNEWVIPKTTDTLKQSAGAIKRISVGVVVDLSGSAAAAASAQGGTAQPANATPLTVAQVEALVKKTVGFDDSRGDQITVVDAPVVPDIEEDLTNLASTQRWELATQIIRNGSLGLAAVCALLMGMVILKKIQPVTMSGSGESTDDRRERLLSDLSNRVRENPEVISRILAAWQNPSMMDGESGAGNDGSSTKRAA